MTDGLIKIELAKEDMKFSAAHFTIFSSSERENLHGHNFHVSVEIDAQVLSNGLCFDYAIYKSRLRNICKQWDEITLLPGLSTYLTISEMGDYVNVKFSEEEMSFLKRDVLVLPVKNTTVEEFSRLILQSLIIDQDELSHFQIQRIRVSVSSGNGQSASSYWP